MNRTAEALAAMVFFLGSLLVFSQTGHAQQFGPPPQAMYKQHPGSAPSFVNYGEPNLRPKVGALRGSPKMNARPVRRGANGAGVHRHMGQPAVRMVGR